MYFCHSQAQAVQIYSSICARKGLKCRMVMVHVINTIPVATALAEVLQIKSYDVFTDFVVHEYNFRIFLRDKFFKYQMHLRTIHSVFIRVATFILQQEVVKRCTKVLRENIIRQEIKYSGLKKNKVAYKGHHHIAPPPPPL